MTLNSSVSPPAIPDIVYHYTSAEALLKILQRRRLHAGSSRGLNDKYELQAGLDALKAIASKRGEGTTAHDVWELVDDASYSDDANKVSVYVLSASKNGDDTAQWANYADDGRGYALGIRTNDDLAIESSVPKVKKFWPNVLNGYYSALSSWQPVLYAEDEVSAAFDRLFTHVEGRRAELEAMGKSLGPDDNESAEAAELFMQEEHLPFEIDADAHSLIHRIKSEPWKAEAEYRRIVVLNEGGGLKQFKSSASGITSHVNLVTTAQANSTHVQFVPEKPSLEELPPLPIAEVICGPRVDPDNDRDLEALLAETGHSQVQISHSEALLR